MKWRRILKTESLIDWMRRRYTSLKKWTVGKSTPKNTISFRQYQQKQHGGKSIEKQIAERRAHQPPSQSTLQAQNTRKINKRVQEEYGDYIKLSSKDAKLIFKSSIPGYQFSEEDRQRISQLYRQYPQEIVNEWFYTGRQKTRTQTFVHAVSAAA